MLKPAGIDALIDPMSICMTRFFPIQLCFMSFLAFFEPASRIMRKAPGSAGRGIYRRTL